MSSRRSRSGGTSSTTTFNRKYRVLAEVAVGDFLLEVPVGRRDDPAVGGQQGVTAHAAELSLLQHAQQLRLQRQRHVGDLVEEQGAAGGLLELADRRSVAPVKAPRSWPNISLSRRSAGIALQLTATNGPCQRSE